MSGGKFSKRKADRERAQTWRGKATALGIRGILLYLTPDQVGEIDAYIAARGWAVCSARAAVKAYESKLSLEQAEAAAKLKTELVVFAI